jgi:hypothetical protein
MRQIYTQMTDPNKNIWIPCLESQDVPHSPIHTDSVFVTHYNAVEHYCKSLLDHRIYCIGPKTEERLKSAGHDNVVNLGLKASDVTLPDEPITWLHSDAYARDFSLEHNVQAVQVYRIAVNIVNVELAVNICPDRVWIYSQRVIEAFEQSRRTETVELMCTDSCDPNNEVWFNVTRFYPS